MIKWKTTKKDILVISKIANRAIALRPQKKIDLEMDITACHLNGCPLDLERMLKADDFNFMHDISGISSHIDRTTGKLLNCFLPRFAKTKGRKK